MPKLYWEDFQPGAVMIYGPRLVTREEIVAFAAEFDPQPMHLDEAAASATPAGRACRLRLAHLLSADAHHYRRLRSQLQLHGRARRRGSALAQAAAARHAASACARPCSKRASPSSRPEMGLAKIHHEVLDETDAVLTTLTSTAMLGRRQPGARAVKYFEDIQVGEVIALGRHTFTAEEIKAFAAALRSAAVPSGRGGGAGIAFRRALRLRLAHRGDLDAADGRIPPPQG